MLDAYSRHVYRDLFGVDPADPDVIVGTHSTGKTTLLRRIQTQLRVIEPVRSPPMPVGRLRGWKSSREVTCQGREAGRLGRFRVW